ncbi:MAG: extracellular solute-binding protein [Faecousia sp.]
MKKLLAILLAMILCIGIFAACGQGETPATTTAATSGSDATTNNEPATEPPASTKLCDKPTKLYVYDNWDNVPTTVRDDEIHDLILETTGVDLQMPVCADYYNNRAIFLTSDEPIDLMLESCWWATDLIGQGAYQPVTELVEQYGTEFNTTYNKAGAHNFTIWGGEVYGMGGYNAQSLYGIWINKTMLDELNLAVPTTMDEMNTVLYAMKAADAESYPLVANWTWLQRCFEGSFTESYMDWYDESADTLKPDFMMPGYTTFLTQVKTWYTDGILPDFINPAVYSNDLFQTAMMTGKVGVFCENYNNAPTYIKQVQEAHPEVEYVFIGELTGTDGRSGFEPRPIIPYFYAVPTKSENAELAVKFLNWAMSEEGYMLMTYGVEGVDYEFNANGELVKKSDYTGCWCMTDAVGKVYAPTLEGTDLDEGSSAWYIAQYGDTGILVPQDSYGVNMDLSSISTALKDQNSSDTTMIKEAYAKYMWADATLEDWQAALSTYAANNADYMAARTEIYKQALAGLGTDVAGIRASLGK